MKALLLSTNRESIPQPVYPIGLECIKNTLEQADIETDIIDFNTFGEQEEKSILSQSIKNFHPDFILISIRNIDSIESFETRFYIPNLVQIINYLRTLSKAPIILGGSGFSLFPREIIKETGADYGIKGPGEGVIAGLLTRLRNEEEISGVSGLVYRDQSGSIKVNQSASDQSFTGVSPRSAELVQFYWRCGGLQNIETQRGCSYRCIYCTYPWLANYQSCLRPIDDVVEEIEILFHQHGIDRFFIVDSVFNLHRQRVDEFAGRIIDRKLPIKWTGFFTPKRITPQSLKMWKQSGLYSIEFGIDTISEELLNYYGKGFSTQETIAAAKMCYDLQLPYSIFLIFAGPKETRDTVEETIRNAQLMQGAVFLALIGMRIYPNTRLYQLAVDEGVINTDTNLVRPVFYISPLFEPDYLVNRMANLATKSNWLISGHGLREKEEAAHTLHRSGYKGSLWEYCTAD